MGIGPAQHGVEIAVGDRELLAHDIVALASCESIYMNLPMMRSRNTFLASSAIAGLNSGLKFLCNSPVMKFSYSSSL